MKERYRERAKLNAPSKAIRGDPPLRMLDFPGVQELEDMLLLRWSGRGELAPEIQEAVEKLSRAAFGVTRQETEFNWPEEYQDLTEWQRIQTEHEKYESRFRTRELADDETVEVLLRLGLDFRDVNGQPLRCTLPLGRQAEAAARRIKGKVPDRASIELERWGRSLEESAREQTAKKRSG